MADDEKQDDKDDEKVGDLSRDPDSAGNFVPPLWLGKIIKFARGR
jgi:hypothetical protein